MISDVDGSCRGGRFSVFRGAGEGVRMAMGGDPENEAPVEISVTIYLA